MNLEQPLVSICIPSYNAELFIQETIQSVLNSAYNNLEIIVSDDNSIDQTQKIVENVKDDRIYLYINDKKMGVPGNWNQAIEKSKGEIICFLNHDDLIGPHWLEYAADKLIKYPHVQWVSSNFLEINTTGEVFQYVRKFKENRIYEPSEIFRVLMRQNGLGPGFIIRRNVLEKIGLFDETMGPAADNDLFIRFSIKYPMFFSTTPHTYRRTHSRNLSLQWPRSDQARVGYQILEKTFSQAHLPTKMKKMKNEAYLYFNYKTTLALLSLCKQGNWDVLREILEIQKNRGIDFS